MEGVVVYNQDKQKLYDDYKIKLWKSKSVISVDIQHNDDEYDQIRFKSKRSKIYNQFIKYLEINNYSYDEYNFFPNDYIVVLNIG